MKRREEGKGNWADCEEPNSFCPVKKSSRRDSLADRPSPAAVGANQLPFSDGRRGNFGDLFGTPSRADAKKES
jgi:hypothetical protein